MNCTLAHFSERRVFPFAGTDRIFRCDSRRQDTKSVLQRYIQHRRLSSVHPQHISCTIRWGSRHDYHHLLWTTLVHHIVATIRNLLLLYSGTLVAVISRRRIFLWFSLYVQHYYRQTSRELKRLSSVSLSPIYAHFTESVSGLTTIRSFRKYETFRWEVTLLSGLGIMVWVLKFDWVSMVMSLK